MSTVRVNENIRIFEAKGVSMEFGGLRALDDVNIHIYENELFGLIGPNGAGKTTFFNIITGFLKPTSGSLVYKGGTYNGLKPHDIAKKGIVRTFQLTTIFSNVTAEENIIIARHLKIEGDFWGSLFHTKTYRKRFAKIRGYAEELLSFVGMGGKQDVVAKNLAFGDQRRLELAVALAAEPKLLLLDEPVTGMNVEECADLMRLIHSIQARGITVLIVEHNVKLIMDLCERIAVLDFGAKIAEGTPQEIANNEKVITVYLGKKDEDSRR